MAEREMKSYFTFSEIIELTEYNSYKEKKVKLLCTSVPSRNFLCSLSRSLTDVKQAVRNLRTFEIAFTTRDT